MARPLPDPCAAMARYFDGELAPAEEAVALEHLAGCARCQAELGDLMGIDVALRQGQGQGRGRGAGTARSPRRRGAIVAIAGLGVVAIAAVIALLVWPRSSTPRATAPALALAPTRAAEVRFSAPAIDRHRPYRVDRGAAGRESFSMTALADLEKRGELATLAAAHALAGELARAEATLAALPPSPARDADLAAAALLAGRPEDALVAADRALAVAPLTTARWNRAIALRELGLPVTAAAELEEVARAGEPGWADEARARAEAMRAPASERLESFERFNGAALAMIDRSGPPLAASDARARPGLTRLFFLDALRASSSREEALALAPLAAELDRASGHDGASRAVTQVAAADFTRRAPLALEYRKLATYTLDATQGAALLSRLDRAGAAFADLQVGAIVILGRGRERHAALHAYAATTRDPWFALLAVEQRAEHMIATGDRQRAEVLLLDTHAGCDGRAWAYRCAKLAMVLTELYGVLPMYPEAERWAREAERGFAVDGAVGPQDNALAQVAEIRRARQQGSLARATFAELRARAGTACQRIRFVELGLAMLDIYDAAPTIRAPEPNACDVPPAAQEVGFMVNRARMTGRADDRARAEQWIAAARAAGEPLASLAALAAARLDVAAPGAAARLAALVTRFTGPTAANERSWLFATRIDEAGGRQAWSEVLAIAAEDVGARAPARCALVAALDDVRGTAVVVDAAGAIDGVRTLFERPGTARGDELVPTSVRARLAGCDRVTVFAPPPLHGRADLLPAAMPWSFAVRAPLPPASAPRRELIVGDVTPPAGLGLPALAPVTAPPGAVLLRGTDATPARVLAELRTASYAELHVHGQVDLAIADESYLALSTGADGRWALSAADLRKARLEAAPVIVLAACRAAEVAPYLVQRWSLPDAFLAAGARAVIAPTIDVPDDEAAAFFAELRARIAGGEAPARALATLRAARLKDHPESWAASVVLFE